MDVISKGKSATGWPSWRSNRGPGYQIHISPMVETGLKELEH